MRHVPWVLFVLALSAPAATIHAQVTRAAHEAAIKRSADLRQLAESSKSPVRERGLVANFFKPRGSGRHPAIIVVGGSEGGLDSSDRWGKPLADEGFAVLTLAYFGIEGLPAQLDEIPLEYFKTAIDWVRAHPSVDADRVGFAGISRGGDAALVVAATYPEIKAVVAVVPSHVVFAAIHAKAFANTSAWTVGGKPLPFVPYDTSQRFTSLLDLYTRSLRNAAAVEAATTPVERINGPVLLISGGDDRMWPSSTMADQVVQRLERKRFGFPVEHLRYERAGHAIGGQPRAPNDAPSALPASFRDGGGTVEENAKARADGWTKTLAFLKRALKVDQRQ